MKRGWKTVYIPIWLDLLYSYKEKLKRTGDGLHSNMVRFIIHNLVANLNINFEFTFQYG